MENITLLKVDYNIPSLSDTERITASIPTIKKLIAQNKTIVLLTHYGRPEGKRLPEFSTQKLIPTLSRTLKKNGVEANVVFVDQTTSFVSAHDAIANYGVGKPTIVLLENTRFLHGEESKDIDLRRQLAEQYSTLGSEYINEAFSLSHRQEVTNTELMKLLPSSYGLHYQKEVKHLRYFSHPQRPFTVLMGGAKLETKLTLVESMCKKADNVLIGGMLPFTFLFAQGIYHSDYEQYVEKGFIQKAKSILDMYSKKIIVAKDFIESAGKLVDIGYKSREQFAEILGKAKSIFWNGCMGHVEAGYSAGNDSVIDGIVKNHESYSVVGGGDTVASIPQDLRHNFDWVSMGGGATLHFLKSV